MDEGVASQPPEPAPADAQLAALLQGARGGDVAAFEAFYARTVRLVLPAVRRICGDGHCEDALAEAYFQAWRSVASFDAQRGSALAWIRTIARSRALDCLRTERRLHDGVAGAPDFDADAHACEQAGPQQLAEQRELERQLQDAVGALPARQRQLLGLAYQRGCTHGEISELTGLSLGTVRQLLRQSHVRLQDTLGGGGGGPLRP